MLALSAGSAAAKVTSRSVPPARIRPLPLALARRNQPLFAPWALRTYRSSPARTTQIVTYGRRLPSARRELETHVFGPVSMIKALLPGMRARRSGAIVNISTIGVQIMPMGSGYYAASKAALEAMSGALHAELKPLGITV